MVHKHGFSQWHEKGLNLSQFKEMIPSLFLTLHCLSYFHSTNLPQINCHMGYIDITSHAHFLPYSTKCNNGSIAEKLSITIIQSFALMLFLREEKPSTNLLHSVTKIAHSILTRTPCFSRRVSRYRPHPTSSLARCRSSTSHF